MTATRMRLVIRGRVQGVWYRGSMQEQAGRLGVVGWVRNADDGTVEAVIEGPADALRQLVSWCREGPSGARVAEVRCHDEAPEGLRDFRILR